MPNLTTPSVQSYLDELDQALRDVPYGRRQEITRDIRAHIDAGLADAPQQTPTVIATLLDQLGTPAEIAEAAREELPPVRPRIAARDVFAMVLLLIGGFIVPLLGWILGAAMLWTSTAWRTKDKLIATLLVPGGLLTPGLLLVLLLRSSSSCGPASTAPASSGNVQACATTAGPAMLTIVLLIITVTGPVFTTFWLTRHAQRRI